jgi:uncharacterized alkaline shock family protein YloU
MEYHLLPADSSLGRVRIANSAVEQIVVRTVGECYGVVGMGARGGRVGRLATRAKPTLAVDVKAGPEGLSVRLDVVVEHGLNLAEVAATVRSRVVYEVKRLTGFEVAVVEVRISHVRRSA